MRGGYRLSEAPLIGVRGERAAVRGAGDAFFGDDCGHEAGGRHVERGVVRVRDRPRPGSRSSIGIASPFGRREVDRRRRAPRRRTECRARAPPTRRRTSRSCSRRRRSRRCDRRRRSTTSTSPARHQRRGRAVGHERRVDAEPLELPHREARALQQRPGLVDPHPRSAAWLGRGADHTERGAVADAGQRTGVAMRQHPAVDGQQTPNPPRRVDDCALRRRRRSLARPRARPCAPPDSNAAKRTVDSPLRD